MRVGAVASELGLSTQAVRNLIHSGQLEGSKGANGRWQIDASSFNSYAAEHVRKKRSAPDMDRIERKLDELAHSIKRLETDGAPARVLDAVERERDRYRAEAAGAREAALRAVAAARDACFAIEQLLPAIREQNDALTQLLVPGSPQDLMR
jgi:hypothetical protein